MKDTFFCANQTINCQGTILDLSKPKIMGILNVTPDSFHEESRLLGNKNIITKVTEMINNGADIIDVGGYSSRPGAHHLSVQEEIDRVTPVIAKIRSNYPNQIISVDTFRSKVAKAAINEGADIVNDISGGELDENMLRVVGKENTPYIMMHMHQTPQNMQDCPLNSDKVVSHVLNFFTKQIALARAHNVKDIILDPGFGFGKTLASNYTLLRSLTEMELFELPILVGLSRKSMIYKSLNGTSDTALNGTTFLHALALNNGANVLRVHDAKEAKECVNLWNNYYTLTDL